MYVDSARNVRTPCGCARNMRTPYGLCADSVWIPQTVCGVRTDGVSPHGFNTDSETINNQNGKIALVLMVFKV